MAGRGDEGGGAKVTAAMPGTFPGSLSDGREWSVDALAVLKTVTEYDPAEDALWGAGEAVPYLHVARALAALNGTTKRLSIMDGLTNAFR